ncbi:hypothetical protein ACHQM5_019373 [Ranunculus cassubicifolius]
MSDSTSSSPLNPISIVDSEYCVPDEIRFHIGRKCFDLDEYSFTVTDDSGKINWEIIMYNPLRGDNKFRVHDNEGKIIMTLQESNFEVFSRSSYAAYKGDSTEEKDFLFSVTRTWGLFWKCDLKGYLPSTKEEKGGFDFEVVAFWLNKDFVVKQKGGHVLVDGYFVGGNWIGGSSSFNVIVSSNVDYAFIVALAVMFFDSSIGSARVWKDHPDDIVSD